MKDIIVILNFTLIIVAFSSYWKNTTYADSKVILPPFGFRLNGKSKYN